VGVAVAFSVCEASDVWRGVAVVWALDAVTRDGNSLVLPQAASRNTDTTDTNLAPTIGLCTLPSLASIRAAGWQQVRRYGR
jgi:hypothetical protein